MFYFYLQRSKISTKFQYFYFSACSVSSICSLATADTGVKFDNLCIKRQTLRQSTEQRRPTADYGPPGRKRPLPRGRSWRHCWYSLNTSLPASAACERLFSCEGLTMNSHRTCMSDKLFEQLSVIQGEQALVQSAMTSTPSPILTTYTACRWWWRCYWRCNLLTVCADHCTNRND